MRRGDRVAVALALAAAVALRLAFVTETAGHPLYQALTGDPALYHAQALDILAGHPVPDAAYFHSSPLYPFFLAALIRVFAGSLTAVRLAQAAVGVVSVLLVTLLARTAFGRRAAVVAAWLAALYVPFVFFESEVLEIALVVAFVTGALLVLAARRGRATPASAGAAGLLLGLGALGKPNLLLFAPVGSALLFAETAGPRVRRAVTATAFFVAAGAAVLPATVHNWRASGDLIPVSWNGGINLFIGNHAGASGMFEVPPEMRLDLPGASTAFAERALGRRLSAGEVSDYWAGRARSWMLSQPGAWLGLLARKTALFWNAYEVPNHYHFYFVREFAPALRLPVSTFGVVAPLGILGLGMAVARGRPHARLLIAYGVTFMASVVLFFITARYRLAIAPVLLASAGFAVTELWALARGRRWRPLAVAAVALAALAAGVNAPMVEFGFAPMHNAVGTILGGRGDYEGAAEAFSKAVAEDPGNISARYNLGLALAELGRLEEAARAFERAVELYPAYGEAREALARAREELSRRGTASAGERRDP
jgi:4-amino-4-deoxy-L-arabinose transferase-like glycosyltransferase